MDNCGKVLDEGILKYLEHYRMKTKKPIYYVRRYQDDYIESLDLKQEDRLKSITEICNEGLDLETYCMNYYNVEKWENYWALSISPNWKGTITNDMLKHFLNVMELFYTNTRRFTYMKYVLECGGEGNFLHCHAVFKLNTKKPGNMKSLRKGNFMKEFRSCWDRIGYVGYVKSRHALHSTLITNEEMLKDKLDYLQEELKPESHKNAVHKYLPVVEEMKD